MQSLEQGKWDLRIEDTLRKHLGRGYRAPEVWRDILNDLNREFEKNKPSGRDPLSRSFMELDDTAQFILDSNGRVIYANPALANLLECNRAAIEGCNWYSAFMNREDANNFRLDLASRKQCKMRCSIRTAEDREVEVDLLAVRSEDRIQGSLIDLRKSRALETEISASRSQFSELLETMNEGLVVLDDQNCIRFGNEYFCKLCNMSAEEILGKTYYELFPNISFSGLDQNIGKGESRDHFELELQRPGAQNQVLWISRKATINNDGSYAGSLDVFTDISTVKQVQRELSLTNERLSRSVDELKRFTWAASHDLQEPLRSISSFMQLLQKRYSEQLDEQALEYIGFAQAGAKKLKALIRDLRDYSSMSADEDCQQSVDLNVLCGKLNYWVQHNYTGKQEQIQLEIGSLPELEKANPDKLLLLLEHLLDNAIKYHDKDQVRIRIEANRFSDRNRQGFLMTVEDDGPGIDLQYRETVFQVFRRLVGIDRVAGSGMGLALCRKIVDQHSGRIWVEESSMGGTMVCIFFPQNIIQNRGRLHRA
jgi:PAS domain S-box-containing protein